MQINMIVSANYRNRTSEFRWLVRKADQQPEMAEAFKSVKATSVVFCPSTAYETGFGCSTVAFCVDAIGSNDDAQDSEVEGVRLKFDNFLGSFWAPDDSKVEACQALHLRADGSMYAVVANETAIKAELGDAMETIYANP